MPPTMVLLQFPAMGPLQIPGFVELLIVLLMFLILLVPLGILAFLLYLFKRRGDRVEALESRIEEIEGDLERRE